MKVLHIIDSLGLGGAQTVVKGIFESQQENQDIYLYDLRKRDIQIDVRHKNVFHYHSTRKYSFIPLYKMRKIIKDEGIEVLHCHLMRSNIFGWLLKSIWFKDTKLVIHEHGGIGVGEFGYIQSIKIIKDRANVFVAVSKTIEKELIHAGVNQDKIKVLYNFIDTDKFKPIDSKIDGDHFVVGFAGRLVEAKGWREFVMVAKVSNETNKNIRFMIAGDGPDKIAMMDYITHNNLTNVQYVGYVKNMSQFYNNLDCFVQPSHRESMGLSHIEAMACGVPVVVSNVPALNELVEDGVNGFLFEKSNCRQMLLAIDKIYSNHDKRDSLVLEGMSFAKKFSKQEYIDSLKHCYDV